MCESCRDICIEYYGDDEIWVEANRFYKEHPSAGVIGHIVYEDDNLELHHLAWTQGYIDGTRKALEADYGKEEVEAVYQHLGVLYEMAESKLGWTR